MKRPRISPQSRLIPRQRLITFFESLGDWVVLRNGDLLGNLERGGDCDILVGDTSEAEAVLIQVLGRPLYVARRSYVTGYYFSWGYIDVFKDYQWKGIRLFDADFAFSYKTINEHGFPVLAEPLESCVLLLTSLLWGGFVKERYIGRICSAWKEFRCEFEAHLRFLIGPRASSLLVDLLDSGEIKMAESHVLRIRFYVFVHHFPRYPLQCVVGYLNFIKKEIILRLTPPIAPLVVLESKLPGILRDQESMTKLSETALIPPIKIINLAGVKGFFRFRMLAHMFRSLGFLARSGFVVFIVPDFREARVRRVLFWRLSLPKDSPVFQIVVRN